MHPQQTPHPARQPNRPFAPSPDGHAQDAGFTTCEVKAADAPTTQVLGARLGRAMIVGDVVALTGPLGSGKTTFAQGIAVGLEVAGDRHVASPTFALVNEHPGRVPFVHAGFYRIKSEAELGELGLEEAYDRAAAALEWAERFPAVVPADHLHVVFETEADGSRRLLCRAVGPRGRRLAAALADDSAPAAG
jgi:tRNA threonylcarbamoyladenosine biosynthesis protein TsaE